MDREDQDELVRASSRAKVCDQRPKIPEGEVLADIFSYSVNTGAPIRRVLRRNTRISSSSRQIERVQIVTRRKKRSNAMDFDDLL